MNPNVIRTALKITVSIAGSVAVGYLIKGEGKLTKAIEARWPKDSVKIEP